MKKYIIELNDNRDCELSISGGKGANLAKSCTISRVFLYRMDLLLVPRLTRS